MPWPQSAKIELLASTVLPRIQEFPKIGSEAKAMANGALNELNEIMSLWPDPAPLPGPAQQQLESYFEEVYGALQQGAQGDAQAFEGNVARLPNVAAQTRLRVVSAIAADAAARALNAEQRAAAQEAKLAELEPIIRENAVASASVELQAAYSIRADNEGTAWKRALAVVVGVAFATVGAAVLAQSAVADVADDAGTVELVSATALPLLIIAIGLYLIRLSVEQFRAHRHLQVLNKSKADALATFHRIVGSHPNADVQAAIATALAQFVFNPGSTGLIDTGGDHITIVDTLASTLMKR